MKVGDSILIPKGTPVFDRMAYGTPPVLSKRTVRSTITHIFTGSWKDFVSFQTGRAWMKAGITNSFPLMSVQTSHPLVAAEKARIDALMEHDYKFVMWGGRYARLALVQPANKPKPKERKLTTLKRMVIGSRWRLTKDIRITDVGGRPLFDVSLGEFSVIGKPRAMGRGNGTAVPIQMHTSSVNFLIDEPDNFFNNPFEWNGLHLPVNQIEDVVIPVDEPVTISYLLKDLVSGEYFGGFIDDYSSTPHRHIAKMSQTFKSAKKFAALANVKASIMSWTGYYDGISNDNYASSVQKMELPSSWVVVPVNPITLVEGEQIDIQEWYRELIRLRELTVKFGSSLRTVYLRSEGRTVESFIVVAAEHGNLDASVVQEIDIVVANMTGERIRSKNKSSIAFACDFADAMLVKMAFTRPGLSVGLYDAKTLDEIVEPREGAHA